MSEASVPPPPLGHECCPCAQRLRIKNKRLSDEWTRRTADAMAERDGLRAQMAAAEVMLQKHRVVDGNPTISHYIPAAVIAAALREAEEARAKAELWERTAHRERASRIAKERQIYDRNDRLEKADNQRLAEAIREAVETALTAPQAETRDGDE